MQIFKHTLNNASMDKHYFISIYLDTRRAKINGKYPVKLRVFTKYPRIQKLYPTAFELTESEFKSIWETTKPRNEHKEMRLKLQAIETKANETAESLKPFTFESFEKLLFSKTTAGIKNVNFYYNIAIEDYIKNKQIGTALNYEFSIKSLLEFHNKSTLSFYTITVQWLKDYENYMVEDKNRSKTTVGMYLRPLRAVFNSAILDKTINPDVYPFRKKKYEKNKYIIPAPKKTKKALSKEQVKILIEGTPQTPEQEKAKAFWFFSYFCNGMNTKDIANLKYKNISGDTLTFIRAKTAKTNIEQTQIIAILNDFTFDVIEKYGNPDKSPNNYIFSIVEPTASPENKHNQIINFIRYVNQHFLKYAKGLGLTEKISTYWARHSFVTNAIRNDASMELVSELLGHVSVKTTKGYFDGFDNETKRALAKKLMEF